MHDEIIWERDEKVNPKFSSIQKRSCIYSQ